MTPSSSPDPLAAPSPLRRWPSALSASGLIVERGGRTILRDVGLRASAGRLLELRGANGAGKTTLLRTLAGYIAPTAGKISIEDGADDREVPEIAHFVGHLNGLKATLSVAENLDFWSTYLDPPTSAQDREERIETAIETFRLGPLQHLPVSYLSAGQKRRTSLARLHLAPRPIWLLDEPTSSLDTQSAALMTRLIEAHLAEGGIVIAATHLPLCIADAETLMLARNSVGGAP